MKKELLYVNEEAISNTLEDYNAKAKEVNEAINEAEKLLLSKELFQKDKESLLKYGWIGVQHRIRSTYGFPNGDIDAVLKLQGLDATKAKAMFVNVASWHSAIGFEVNDNNEVVLSPQTVAKVENRSKYYTKNEKQLHALELAKNMCVLLNDSHEKELIPTSERADLLRVKAISKFIKLSSAPRNEQVFVPAVKKIAQIRG